MKPQDPVLTPPYAGFLVRLTRPFPDFDVSFMKPVRERAVRLLRLSPGDRVLDLGCGMGGSFPYLAAAVGATGEVVGVEISPEVVVNARRRIEKNGWDNVRVVRASAQDAELVGAFDAALAFAAPDVYASPSALENLFAHLRPGGRIVVFGAKTARRGAGVVLNPVLRRMVASLSFGSTPLPSERPWGLVAERSREIEVVEYFFGTMFLASATYSPVSPSP